VPGDRADGAILVETGMIAEAAQEQLQRLRLDDRLAGQIGQTSALPASPEEAVLDYVPNPRPGRTYLVRFAVQSSWKPA
jgi:hypothetical protein